MFFDPRHLFKQENRSCYRQPQKQQCTTSKVPPYNTQLFQPLNVTLNKFLKDFMKNGFCQWSAKQILLGIIKIAQERDDIQINYKLTSLKPQLYVTNWCKINPYIAQQLLYFAVFSRNQMVFHCKFHLIILVHFKKIHDSINHFIFWFYHMWDRIQMGAK